jgi:ATP adenylyltransferase
MSFDQLWAGWRHDYVTGAIDAQRGSGPHPAGDQSLFEQILSDFDDEEGGVVWRGARCSALLNAYPYTNGHVLVLPNRAVPDLEDLDVEEHREMWAVVRDSVVAIKAAYDCDGVNVGMNLGEAGGAGIPDHLHVHVLPRWTADTNFMTTVAETRVLPETLSSSWRRLRDHWPVQGQLD